eukprot:gnl/TRDRNA2_/TRDRNA2_86653_c0_seq2.p1 gnl/TRDRNA2_/TRDRNA2_86653_c0~~gnl/TRDRNA2_/TRDRNA2_86653_c0_seq2.p1  ORF type:complete len:408 (-),score=50.59 gnl/TRDRNA2_/TRDRNA2_86653_c0_seq2:68-1168(-)
MLNAGLMGLESDYLARHWLQVAPPIFDVANLLFCCVFTIEISIRLKVFGCSFFTSSWNLLDIAVVGCQVLEVVLRVVMQRFVGWHAVAVNHLTNLRVLRFFRLVRVIRLVRVLRFIRELRALTVSIIDTLRSLLWTLALIAVVTYMFGVFLTEVVTEHKVHLSHEEILHERDLLTYYGSLDRAMLKLWEAVSEGVHWSEIMAPLVKYCSPWYAILFVIYMSFTIFALMNVITGVFVESAIRTAEDDTKRVLLYQMRDLFREADPTNSGTIRWEQLEAQLDSPQMQSYLRAIDLDPDEARALFFLLDTFETGEIDADQLIHGCLRLHGSAKAIELAAFIQEFRFSMREVKQLVNDLHDDIRGIVIVQ